VTETIANVPFAIIEEAPIFPGCEKKKSKADRRKCLQEKISRHIDRKFDKGLANDLGLEGRQKIQVQFTIDEKGKVVDIKSRAPHPRLTQETQEVIDDLPDMIPGKQRGKAVKVTYTLPIIFDVRN
jgi:protein TonB